MICGAAATGEWWENRDLENRMVPSQGGTVPMPTHIDTQRGDKQVYAVDMHPKGIIIERNIRNVSTLVPDQQQRAEEAPANVNSTVPSTFTESEGFKQNFFNFSVIRGNSKVKPLNIYNMSPTETAGRPGRPQKLPVDGDQAVRRGDRAGENFPLHSDNPQLSL